MTCDIIQFSTLPRPARTVSEKPSRAEVTAICERIERTITREMRERELPPPQTETAKNARIRDERRDAWWLADRVADYWRARLDWKAALDTAQRYGIGDSASFPSAAGENENRFELVDKWREAVAKQLLTPSPTLAAVTWKRAKLKSRDFPYLPVKKERVERVIADDVAFLAAHPTRARKGN